MTDDTSMAAEQSGDEAALDEARASYAPVAALAALNQQAQLPKPEPLPTHLPVSSIKLLPELFQPRGGEGMNERHIQELKQGLLRDGALEPVTVIWIGPDAYLVDGHHRISAYRQAKHGDPIPVTTFEGAVEAAVLEAGKANTRTKLPMDNRERQNYAWRLTLWAGTRKRGQGSLRGYPMAKSPICAVRRDSSARRHSAVGRGGRHSRPRRASAARCRRIKSSRPGWRRRRTNMPTGLPRSSAQSWRRTPNWRRGHSTSISVASCLLW